uniref:ATP-dependent RNA helicase Ski2/MTR4 C-terminal domain-containing protein n=1 Tax=Coccolithus braarudii TaxID=221442 RepID=A0A7S0LTH6_9EUKA
MPARSVVFSQLDKPNDGDLPGHRPLRPDEFWQMAGRAGRRGMDVLGYVVYAPSLSVAGLRNLASGHELREMLVGKMPTASSQLSVDRPFVLRHLNRGYGPDVLEKTLLQDQLRRRSDALSKEIDLSAAQAEAQGGSSAEILAAAQRYAELEAKVSGESAEFGARVALNPKARKKLEAEMRTLKDAHGEALHKVAEAVSKREGLERDRDATVCALRNDWRVAFDWLEQFGFIASGTAADVAALTARGRACAAFADGQPLIIGTIISDGWLTQLSLPEVCAWLCLFLQERRLASTAKSAVELPDPPPSLQEVMSQTFALGEMLEVELDPTLSMMMLDWCTHKDITRVASWLDAHMLGVFVKAVLRVVSYVDVVREVLLGLNDYEAYNKLDHHTDLLLGGLVTNESLYLRMGD